MTDTPQITKPMLQSTQRNSIGWTFCLVRPSIVITSIHISNPCLGGSGFLDVPDYTSHTLPPPMHFPSLARKDVFSIAVFHELHCLMHISGVVDKLVMKVRNKDFSLNEGELGHNDHCFNYLRNALMCCDDTTLEGQAQTPELKDTVGTDGTGAMHFCRNYNEIVEWAEREKIAGLK
jgi:hypothetical protein